MLVKRAPCASAKTALEISWSRQADIFRGYRGTRGTRLESGAVCADGDMSTSTNVLLSSHPAKARTNSRHIQYQVSRKGWRSRNKACLRANFCRKADDNHENEKRKQRPLFKQTSWRTQLACSICVWDTLPRAASAMACTGSSDFLSSNGKGRSTRPLKASHWQQGSRSTRPCVGVSRDCVGSTIRRTTQKTQ